MTKTKIFIYDELVFGGAAMAECFRNQIFCFPMHTGQGFGLFYSKKLIQRAFLVEDQAWDGAWGDLWECDNDSYQKVHARYCAAGFKQTKIFLVGSPEIITWIMPMKKLKNAKLEKISCLRDHLMQRGKRR